jgi:hypothetical protein
MLILLLLTFAGQTLPAVDDTPDTPPAVIAPVTLQPTTWTGLKHALSTVALPQHHDADDERGLR